MASLMIASPSINQQSAGNFLECFLVFPKVAGIRTSARIRSGGTGRSGSRTPGQRRIRVQEGSVGRGRVDQHQHQLLVPPDELALVRLHQLVATRAAGFPASHQVL